MLLCDLFFYIFYQDLYYVWVSLIIRYITVSLRPDAFNRRYRMDVYNSIIVMPAWIFVS